MNSRIKLDAELKEIAGENVYYQPPESLKMNYPAIQYRRDKITPINADNINYVNYHKYTIIVIDKDPDSELVEKISNFKTCRHLSHYTKDGFNYDVFSLYYDE